MPLIAGGKHATLLKYAGAGGKCQMQVPANKRLTLPAQLRNKLASAPIKATTMPTMK
jgi:hypothetical protein